MIIGSGAVKDLVASPYPLRSNGTNIHLTKATHTEAEFCSCIFVTHIVNSAGDNLSTPIVSGTVRHDEGQLRFADPSVVLQTAHSERSSLAQRERSA
jgi:hypothetical protein